MNIEKLAKKYYTKQGMEHIYVLTMIYGVYDHETHSRFHPSKRTPNSRTVGVSHDVESFRRSLAVDDFDISEGGSNDWAVIEVSNTGLALPSHDYDERLYYARSVNLAHELHVEGKI